MTEPATGTSSRVGVRFTGARGPVATTAVVAAAAVGGSVSPTGTVAALPEFAACGPHPAQRSRGRRARRRRDATAQAG